MVLTYTQLNSKSTAISTLGLPLSAPTPGLPGPAGQSALESRGSICREFAMHLSEAAEGTLYKDQNHNQRRSRKMG